MPDCDASEYLLDAKGHHGKSLVRTVLTQLLPKTLVNELEALLWSSYQTMPLAEIPDAVLRKIGSSLSAWTLKPSGTEGYRTAEVTLRGVDTRHISSKTMECFEHRGLYFIGEVVDVTGHLGGYNFQWAWSSGYAAGSVV